jgi:hypothetical protein
MRRRFVSYVLGLLLAGALSGAGSAAAATPSFNLTGNWSDGEGTSLTLTQSGTTLTWKGGPDSRAWIQEFTGTLQGAAFSGSFRQDAPGVTPQRYHGTMTAEVLDDCHFRFTSIVQAGMPTLSGIEFTRIPCAVAPTALTPVPIETVSNGCGGGDWKLLVKAENFLGNTSTFYNVPNKYLFHPQARPFTVNFKDACDLHDAGYAGAIVHDKLRGGIKDFRKWTRKQVDDMFLADMRLLCQQQIPSNETIALAKCRGTGGNASIGAESRYRFVRDHGARFFDAQPGGPGTPTRPDD